MNTPVEEVWSKGKYRQIVAARSLLCYWAVNELNISISELARRFEVSPTAISKSVLRGKILVKEGGYKLENANV
jgi:putative transposase